LFLLLLAELGLVAWQGMPALMTWVIHLQIIPVSEKLAWYLTRSSGTVAYLTLTLSTVWGLMLSTKLAKQWVPATVALIMHNWLAWIAVGLSAFHAIVLLFDGYYTYTIGNLLIPFTGPYKPLWVGVGGVSFYLLLLTSASFYARRWIGTKMWRRFHYLTFLAFLMVTLHGWMAGSDSSQLKWLFVGSGNLVLFLTLYRILDAMQATRRLTEQQKTRELYTVQLS
jgi:predicted ferric reductase